MWITISKFVCFLAPLSSSRSLVVGWSVGPSAGLSVTHLCEKVTFRVSNGNLNLPKTYLPNYLCDSSDCIYSSDSSEKTIFKTFKL